MAGCRPGAVMRIQRSVSAAKLGNSGVVKVVNATQAITGDKLRKCFITRVSNQLPPGACAIISRFQWNRHAWGSEATLDVAGTQWLDRLSKPAKLGRANRRNHLMIIPLF